MEKLSTITYGVISLLVVVVLIATVAIPVIEDSQKEQHSEVLQSGQKYSVITTSDKVVLGYDAVTSAGTLNGDSLSEYVTVTVDSRIFVISSNAVCVISYTASTDSWGTWTVTSKDISAEAGYTVVLNNASYSATFENGAFTTVGASTYTGTYDFLIIPDDDGTYGAWDYADLPLYVDSDKAVYLMQRINAREFVASGKLDSMVFNFAIVSNTIVSDATITANYEPTDYDASNKVTSFATTGGVTVSGSMIFIPLSYSVISDNQNMITILLGIIPLILIIIPVMLTVQLISGGRRD